MTSQAPHMRGYFGIGIARCHKAGHIGNLIRTAHGFGASFAFLIRHRLTNDSYHFDTAKSDTGLPVFEYEDFADFKPPKRCKLVGIEITDDAVDLPSFRHPEQAAYILGGERYSLSDELIDACDHVIKIPTRFSLNVATAGAIVLYDRLRTLGRFPERGVTPSAKIQPLAPHVHGGPIKRREDSQR